MSKADQQVALALQDPKQWYVHWVEPWSGVDKNEDERTGTCFLKMTVEDVCNYQREAFAVQYKKKLGSIPGNETLLLDFLVTHWAKLEKGVE